MCLLAVTVILFLVVMIWIYEIEFEFHCELLLGEFHCEELCALRCDMHVFFVHSSGGSFNMRLVAGAITALFIIHLCAGVLKVVQVK